MNHLNPHEMAEAVVRMSNEYGEMSEKLADILGKKALKWAEFRSHPDCKSDKAADKQWDATPDGLTEMGLHLMLKACEKKMSALKAMLRVLETEAHNQF